MINQKKLILFLKAGELEFCRAKNSLKNELLFPKFYVYELVVAWKRDRFCLIVSYNHYFVSRNGGVLICT